jgi:hypothetical protein
LRAVFVAGQGAKFLEFGDGALRIYGGAHDGRFSVAVRRAAKLMSRVRYALSEINAMDCDEFVRVVGPAFEHSPWIAERAAARRPFASLDSLHAALCEVVAHATADEQLALIRAHPDLVGRAVLTAESRANRRRRD